jgi:hypothetical protein
VGRLQGQSEEVVSLREDLVRRWVGVLAVSLVALVPAGSAGARVGSSAPATAASRGPAPSCPAYHGSGIPAGSGIPPWGFHAPQSFGGGTRGFAHGWGDVNLGADRISGRICQDISSSSGRVRTIQMTVGPRISSHSHTAVMWGYPGNLIKTALKVVASRDPGCKVGTHGRIVMYASYNGVRSDSMQFIFPRGCHDQARLYHGRNVDAQVPPL